LRPLFFGEDVHVTFAVWGGSKRGGREVNNSSKAGRDGGERGERGEEQEEEAEQLVVYEESWRGRVCR